MKDKDRIVYLEKELKKARQTPCECCNNITSKIDSVEYQLETAIKLLERVVFVADEASQAVRDKIDYKGVQAFLFDNKQL